MHELETTDRPQIRGKQHDGAGFCAAGLLRNLINPRWQKKRVSGETLWYWEAEDEHYANQEYVLRWCAANNCGLIMLNDQLEYTFSQIAERMRHRAVASS